jgi:hypothetical protein
MNSPECLLKASDVGKLDRLPAAKHRLVPSFLDDYLNGASWSEFFEKSRIDATMWVWNSKPDVEIIWAFAEEARSCTYA